MRLIQTSFLRAICALLLFFLVHPVHAEEEVNIPDPLLESVLRDRVDGPLYPSELAGIYNYLTITGSGQTIDLTGLEHLINVSNLTIEDVVITNPDPILAMPRLYDLRLYNAGLTDISFLSGYTRLGSLGLSDMNLLDISALPTLRGLQWLWLTELPLHQIPDLAELTKLNYLWIYDVPISRLDFVANLPNLIELTAWNCEIYDISNVPTTLLTLWLFDNKITDISKVSSLTRLRNLSLDGNLITDLTPLEEHPGLNCGCFGDPDRCIPPWFPCSYSFEDNFALTWEECNSVDLSHFQNVRIYLDCYFGTDILSNFAQLDSNSDGFISSKDALAHKVPYMEADQNSDGFTAPWEFRRYILSEYPDYSDSDSLFIHSADQDGDLKISIAELLRVVQIYNSNGFSCSTTSEDGYSLGEGLTHCPRHSSDFVCSQKGLAPCGDWKIDLSELLRTIQLFNAESYSTQGVFETSPESDSRDGFVTVYQES